MTALTALTPAPVRAANVPNDDTARDSSGGDFAAALDVAREPAPVHAKAAPARGDGKAAGAKASADDAQRAEDKAADDEADAAAPNLALLLPGWPAPVDAAAVDAASPSSSPGSTRGTDDVAPGGVAVGAASLAPTAADPAVPVAAGVAGAAPMAAIAAVTAPVPAATAAPATQAAAATALAPVSREPSSALPSLQPASTPAPLSAAPATATPAAVSAAAADKPRAPGSHAAIAAGVEAAPGAGTKADAAASWTPEALPWPAPTTLGTAPPARPAVAAPFETHLAAALDSPAFAPALANQITWLVHEGQQHARLTINPAEMGPVTVKIVLDGSQARVDFSVDMAATRSAIEASLPALAAALHDSGLTLAGGGVFDGQPRHGAQDDAQPSRPVAAGANSALPGAAASVAAWPPRPARGLVDLVA